MNREIVPKGFPNKICVSEPPALPSRRQDSNKGTYGTVLVVGGAPGMAGAAYLSALAAYRSGAGLVRVFTCEENRVILQTLLPEAVLITYKSDEPHKIPAYLSTAADSASAVVIGPGLSLSDIARLQLETVLKVAASPLIIDADALNILSKNENLWELRACAASPVIITPHMGEMSRLTGKSIEELKASPESEAAAFAVFRGVVCVMKDAETTVSDGVRTYVNHSGCSGLSKGGSGDVLTGVIAALAAQKMPAFDASCLGVYLHGKAGKIASEKLSEYSLLARDIADALPLAFREAQL